ncbi:hypothetical protein GcC1_089024 [Golovinomyces cichoracearum]|uniref:Uncharacterized protein n=1 Tax=Golovinomyces cichoracearum TaxID=62708 RepID=A0A420IG58_9PEZI|nr:hypothetical protein GcC1_089024 [Golovinomyces cichoracearum]
MANRLLHDRAEPPLDTPGRSSGYWNCSLCYKKVISQLHVKLHPTTSPGADRNEQAPWISKTPKNPNETVC